MTRPRRHDPLESLLRSARAEPSHRFADGLAARIDGVRSRRAFPRVAVAGATTALMLAAFGATGGLGYAASAASTVAGAANPISILQNVVAPSTVAQPARGGGGDHGGGGGGGGGGGDHGGNGGGGGDDDNPSHDQYRPGKGCGDRDHVQSRDNKCHEDDHGRHGHGH